MKDLLYLERVEQAETLLKPQRIEVLRQLAEPRGTHRQGNGSGHGVGRWRLALAALNGS